MGQYSVREFEIIDKLVDLINSEIFMIEQIERDKGNLDYSLCSDFDEKQIITKKKIKKFKKNIDNCNAEIAGYLFELTKINPGNHNFYDSRDEITKSFIAGNYQELIEILAVEDNEVLEKYCFESVIKARGFSFKLIENYVQSVCDINHLHTYKTFLDIPNDDISYNQIINKLNDAFFRLEAFMKGTVNDYFHFDFSRAFTELFYYTRKIENFTYDNCKRVGEYWELTEQVSRDYDQFDFENQNAYKNKAFCNDCEIIMSINWDRIKEFTSFATPDEINYETKKKSVVDLMKPILKTAEVTNVKFTDKLNDSSDEQNPYPRIFTSPLAFNKFNNLLLEFGNGAENLANYSFVYHRMVKDKFIYEDYKQTEFAFFLLNFDININRIKPKSQSGKTSLRESIYNSIK